MSEAGQKRTPIFKPPGSEAAIIVTGEEGCEERSCTTV